VTSEFITQSTIFEYARQMERSQNLSDAIEHYRNAIQNGDSPSASYQGLARCLLRQGDYDEAIQSFEKSIDRTVIAQVYRYAKTFGFRLKLNMDEEGTLWQWFSVILLSEKQKDLAMVALNESNRWELFNADLNNKLIV